jgi:hypothetical protein
MLQIKPIKMQFLYCRTQKIRIQLFSLSGVGKLELKGNWMQLCEFIEIFDSNIELGVNFYSIQVNYLQVKNENLMDKLNRFVDKYKEHIKQIHRVKSFLKRLNDKENFLILPLDDLSDNLTAFETLDLELYLLSYSRNISFNDLRQKYRICDELRKKYELILISPKQSSNKTLRIGQPSIDTKVCRFCQRSYPTVAFRKKAHAIPEALGNKLIILNEECDECNEWFGKNIERDIIYYFSIDRILFDIKGKNGIPKLKTKSFEMQKYQDKLVLIIKNRIKKGTDILNDGLDLKIPHKISLQNIYRSLCKFFLSIIDIKYLSYFTDTIAWIKKEKTLNCLPRVAVLSTYHFFTKQPYIIAYIRKNDDYNLPFAVGEFHFALSTFVFIVPLSSKDKKNFIDQNDYHRFWCAFPHFKNTQTWQYLDFSIDVELDFVVNVKFNKAKNR